MSEYSVEEVRARFEAWATSKGSKLVRTLAGDDYWDSWTSHAWEAYQAAYAERIKADEGAVAVARVISEYTFGDHGPESRVAWMYNPMPEGSELFELTTPPAQPAERVAQGEAVGWLVVDAKGKRFTIYNRDLAEAIKQSAEVSGSTLTVMAVCEIPPKGWYCPRGADHAGPCAAWENTQPAQSVDVEKVREALHSAHQVAHLYHTGEGMLWYIEKQLETTAALQEKGNG